MIYSFAFSYLIPIFFVDSVLFTKEDACEVNACEKHRKQLKKLRIMQYICFSIIIYSNIVLANQVYTKKALVYDSTFSTMTRVVNCIESTEDYIPLETPICIYGSLVSNPYVYHGYTEFTETNTVSGGELDIGVTYTLSYEHYFKYILNVPAKFCDSEQMEKMKNREEIARMPVFPEKGYCQLVDGILVVKLSQTTR